MKNTFVIIGMAMLLIIGQSCRESFLDEEPFSLYSTDLVLSSRTGFESYMTSLHVAARNEMASQDGPRYFFIMQAGTDVADFGNNGAHLINNLNLLTPFVTHVAWVWDWAYQEMLLRANTIIVYANRPELSDIWHDEADRNAMIAEARFFRAYTHNMLANLYGGVPIVDTIYTAPKLDFMRNTRDEVLESARRDLEFASAWLPETVERDGRIVKAAADHLLTEVYISLGEYELAVASADKVINSGLYQLMTERFGSQTNQPGDVFSDLFRDGNQNRSSGNLESIYVWQFEDVIPGGQGGSSGNNRLRNWGPYLERVRDPNGQSGMVLVDSLGRGVGQIRPTSYYSYDIWASDWDNDMRNSAHNMRRVFHYTNPSSEYFGEVVEPKTTEIDTMQNIYPYPRKIEGIRGVSTPASTGGRTFQDFMVYRLAETYLLRAEAYFRWDRPELAADDINVVRNRANATPITAADVTEDFILDERARELITEEPRRRTLVRMGRLVDRAREHSVRETTRNSLREFHQWWPIPQAAIDANLEVRLEQTPGY